MKEAPWPFGATINHKIFGPLRICCIAVEIKTQCHIFGVANSFGDELDRLREGEIVFAQI
ncbi:MAG: hypothetical protein MUD10_02730 [Candidatus Pacebacteria bacterium]|jgi:hypothetical protein|nr:hypothetical protein [Candidatus Paceibacterota bacterium]